MVDAVALPLSLLVLAGTLAVAIARPSPVNEAAAAGAGSVLLVAVGAIGLTQAWDSVRRLGPIVGFLAALLLIAEGCRREGLFAALGEVMARRSRSDPRRLLGIVFAVASGVTIVLGLDATVVLLPPIVIATATRLRSSPRAPAYACAHLANSASLLLPVSNLTNLLAFGATGLSFARFGLLMALPTVAAIAVEWAVISRRFEPDRVSATAPGDDPPAGRLPWFACAVLVLTLTGFALSSLFSLAPVWVAVAGAAAINVPALVGGGAGRPSSSARPSRDSWCSCSGSA